MLSQPVRSGWPHLPGVTLRDDADVKEITESPFAAALTARLRTMRRPPET
ncbi:MAG: hypothetical protein ABI112_06665 [Terracoccus sp.]